MDRGIVMVECLSCGGTFQPIQPDGLRYFHACPPVTLRRVTRAGAVLDLPVAQVRNTDLVAVLRAGAPAVTLVSALQDGDVIVGDTVRERANRRDENVPSTLETDRDKLKRPGAGTTIVPDRPAPPDV